MVKKSAGSEWVTWAIVGMGALGGLLVVVLAVVLATAGGR